MNIGEFMTPNITSVTPATTVQTALRTMLEFKFRHLLVREGSKTVGLVSQRELDLLAVLPDMDPERTSVELAMIDEPLSFDVLTPLATAAKRMAQLKMGSAVVTLKGEPVGIFTTTDALNALSQLLGRLDTT